MDGITIYAINTRITTDIMAICNIICKSAGMGLNKFFIRTDNDNIDNHIKIISRYSCLLSAGSFINAH